MPSLLSAALAAALLSPPVSPGPSPAAAVARLQASRPEIRVLWRAGGPSLITGLEAPTAGASPEARASDFLARHADLLKGAVLEPVAVERLGARAVVRLEQHHQGVPVLDRAATVTLDAEGRVVALHNPTEGLRAVAPARVDAAQARALATTAVVGRPAPEVAAKATARAVILARGDQGVAGFEVRVLDEVVRVDAAAGEVVGRLKGWWK